MEVEVVEAVQVAVGLLLEPWSKKQVEFEPGVLAVFQVVWMLLAPMCLLAFWSAWCVEMRSVEVVEARALQTALWPLWNGPLRWRSQHLLVVWVLLKIAFLQVLLWKGASAVVAVLVVAPLRTPAHHLQAGCCNTSHPQGLATLWGPPEACCACSLPALWLLVTVSTRSKGHGAPCIPCASAIGASTWCRRCTSWNWHRNGTARLPRLQWDGPCLSGRYRPHLPKAR